MDKRAFILAVVSLIFAQLVRADQPTAETVLAENHHAMGDVPGVGTVHAEFLYSGIGLSGVASRTSDLATGDFVESYAVGPLTGGSGFDGNIPWMRDLSGANTAEEGGDRPALAVNEAYLNANAWWQPAFGGAAITYVARKTEDGVLMDHLIVTPRNGERFDAWFDARTHLLSRIAEEQGFFATQTFFADYALRNGEMLPLLTTVDRGTGKANYETMKLIRATVTKPLPLSAYSRPTAPPTGAEIVGGASSTTIPFQLLNNHIYIQATVNGKGPFTFIVDTGGHTLLSPRLVASLGLNSQGKAASSGAGEKISSTGFAKVSEIAVGGVRLHDQTAFVTTVYDTAIEGIPVDGMVGFELFRRFGVRIDFTARTLTFYDPAHFAPIDAGREIHFKFYDHLPDVAGFIDGIPARFDIDTGSRGELDVTSPFVRRTGLRVKYPYGVKALTGWGAGGAVEAYVVRLPSISFGREEVSQPVAELSDAKGGTFSDSNFEGNIGTALLKSFVVTFDYAHQNMYLKTIAPPPPDLGTFDRSGLWLNASPSGYVIGSISPRSPAIDAGLAVGDVITALDGRKAEMSGLSDARMRLRNLPARTAVRVDFLRGNVTRTVQLHLRDLIPPTSTAGAPH